MTEAVIIYKPVHWPVWFLYANGLRHERVKQKWGWAKKKALLIKKSVRIYERVTFYNLIRVLEKTSRSISVVNFQIQAFFFDQEDQIT